VHAPLAQTPTALAGIDPRVVQFWQVLPLVPHRVSLCELTGTHVVPLQHPAQIAVQLTSWPQLFCTVPHFPAQVVASRSRVQPQTPAVPGLPPPQVWPVPRSAQFLQSAPPVPHCALVCDWTSTQVLP